MKHPCGIDPPPLQKVGVIAPNDQYLWEWPLLLGFLTECHLVESGAIFSGFFHRVHWLERLFCSALTWQSRYVFPGVCGLPFAGLLVGVSGS